ncbi:PD-(D/E)XK motif protein [Streptomyces sp. NPDC051207]|uniref:PD-(D/E)XK motif protein n=1 Tax=Streptomyces sp. NPDC051207 TaxID=3154641 RepID=UPI00341E97E7
MSDEAFRKVVEETWTALEARPTTAEHRLRVSHLPVETAQGPLAAAVDHEGHRHLLVPIETRRKVRTGLDGPALQLRKRPLEDEDTYQTYADLTCRRRDLNDVFASLCVDVLDTVGKPAGDPVKALYRVLDRWKALFQSQGPVLGPEQLAGLFAELVVLGELLDRDPSAHRLWRGPKGHRHDFSNGTTAVEVKAGTDRTGRRPRIHGLDQLQAPVDGTLCLVWLGLHRVIATSGGTGFVEQVERVLEMCDDETALLGLLAECGYRRFEAEHYRDVRFAVAEERWYEVGPGFPGLTGEALVSAGLPVSIFDVEYTVDLSGDSPAALTSDEIARTIDHMLQESP